MSMAGTTTEGFSWRNVSYEAKLLLVGIPLLIWTLLPIYHLCLFAFSDKQSAFSGNLWPTNPTLRNFEIVFGQKHYFLTHFLAAALEFGVHRRDDRVPHAVDCHLRGIRDQPPAC